MYVESSTHHKPNNFALSYLKGNIGQSIIETYLLEFGYAIYPYGYENNYANITRFVRKDYSDTTAIKLRSMPDILVYDQDNHELSFLQIKTTNTPDLSKYWIKKDDFDCYMKFWSEALLVVYHIPTGNIYCRKIVDIKNLSEGLLPGLPDNGYYLDLSDFSDLTRYFRRVKPHHLCIKLHRDIADILKTFGQQSC